MKLVFATNNKHKLRELQQLLGNKIQLLSLADINCSEDIPETKPTIEGNASQKSFYIYKKYGVNCFADDTGLEIEALNGAPGVFSARYAGEEKNDEENIEKVLSELSNSENRNARFKTIISLVINGKETLFEGIINGTILQEKRGNRGFGYDPVFLPNGYNKPFAEMLPEIKNEISHRGIAVNKLVEFLRTVEN